MQSFMRSKMWIEIPCGCASPGPGMGQPDVPQKWQKRPHVAMDLPGKALQSENWTPAGFGAIEQPFAIG